MHLPMPVDLTTDTAQEMLRFDNQRQRVRGDQEINLAAANVDIGEDRRPSADTRQVFDESGQHIPLRRVLYGIADIEFDHGGARHLRFILAAACRAPSEIAA